MEVFRCARVSISRYKAGDIKEARPNAQYEREAVHAALLADLAEVAGQIDNRKCGVDRGLDPIMWARDFLDPLSYGSTSSSRQ